MDMNSKYYLSQRSKDREKMLDILEELPKYCASFFYNSNNLALKTRLEYAKDLKTFFLFLKKSNPMCKELCIKDIPIDILDSLSVEDFGEYISWLESNNNTERTIGRKVASIKTFYKYMVIRQYLKNNPTIYVIKPKVTEEKEILIFTEEEKQDFLSYIEAGSEKMSKRELASHDKVKLRDYAIFLTLFGTGIRISELTGINIDDIDFEEGELYIHRKGNINDSVFFGDQVSAALMTYLEIGRELLHPKENEQAFFLSMQGKRITERAIEIRLKHYYEEMTGRKTKLSPHKCRATFGSQLYEETSDIYLVADALGHKSVETTKKHYAKMSREHKKKAATMKII